MFSEHSRNIQGTFGEYSVSILGTFREHLVNLQGTFGEHSLNPVAKVLGVWVFVSGCAGL
jgi:hypothetical protein